VSTANLKSHVDFVGALFVVWGLLTVVIGLSTLALSVGAVGLMASVNRGGGRQMAAGVTVAAFTTLAIIAIVWGAAHVAIGLPLRRRDPRARLMALMLGSVDLLLLPYGTALGAYSLWILLSERGKAMFEGADAASFSARSHTV